MIHLPTLYHLGVRKGHVNAVCLQVEGTQTRAITFVIIDGVRGKRKVGAWTECRAKNVGRANATTPEEQAIAQAWAHHRKLRERKGYKLLKCALKEDTSGYPDPMLAREYKPGCVSFPAYMQPKFNGGRSPTNSVGMWTRKRKFWESCPHINKALKPLFKKYPGLLLDGELYNADDPENLNRLMSNIRKSEKHLTPQILEFNSKKAKLYVYDGYGALGVTDSDRFDARWFMLQKLAKELPDCVVLAETRVVSSEEEVQAYYTELLARRYEGGIVRAKGVVYMHGNDGSVRSPGLRKLKPFEDREFVALEALDGKGKNVGLLSKVVCESPKGAARPSFEANVAWSQEKKKELYETRKKWLVSGKTVVTVSFNALTEYGIPYLPYVRMIHPLGRAE